MSNLSFDDHNLVAHTIRGLSMDAVQKANSGHPGMPMGMADVATVLWSQFLKHNPKDPKWANRDRFILSAGHGSMLLYSLLHLSGYDLSLDEIKNFRQWDSLTPGHPESHMTPGVETTTGPLGQGITNAIGFAMAERWLATQFNRAGYPVVDHYTYTIASDGDLMEGVSHEASSLAGHLGLSKLVVLYDDNSITIDARTDAAFTEDVLARYAAYGWHVQRVDGHDATAIRTAIELAQMEEKRPSIIACRTLIGFGSPNKQDTSKAHGSPLGDEEIRLTKENLGWPQEPFFVPGAAYEIMGADDATQTAWNEMFAQYAQAHPELAADFQQAMSGDLPEGWQESIPTYELGTKMATRASSGQVLNAVAKAVPTLLGGSADLAGSNKTTLSGEAFWSADDFSGRNIHFGVREHGMGGIMNGMALHGGMRPYGGTFLVFSDYVRPSIRLAALMEQPVIYVFTHDSIGLGEDGPTHQPIEHLMSLRMMPNLVVFRPADANETAVSWRVALENKHGPTALVYSRQGLATLDPAVAANADKGAYVLSDAENAQAILIGTGSEVHIALEAQQILAEKGVAARVVSMPSWELFAQQSIDYQESVLPPSITARVSIEAGTAIGWERYVGLRGKAIGLNRFGASAPFDELYEQLGLTGTAVAKAALSLL
ncbi:MAG: transketolase [Chloroflexota bacterium]